VRFEASDPTPLLEHFEQLPDGALVFVPGTMSEPRTLDRILADNTHCLRGCHLVDTRLPGFRDQTYPGADCQITSFFLPGELRGDPRARFVPQHYRDTFAWLAEQEFDLVLIEVAPTDDPEVYSHGLTNDFVGAVLRRCRAIVAEVNHALPLLAGAPVIRRSSIDLELHSSVEPRLAKATGSSDEIDAVARNVASLIQDGDCLQTGLGALPDAILHSLHDRRHLGCHSGMLGDGMRSLYDSGALDGSRKTIDRELMVTGFLFGSRELYGWAAGNDQIVLRGVDYTHDIEVLGSIDDFVSINSAVEVDLLGQVNAEAVRGVQVSGTGGAVDFMRGARRSRGGRSIVALPSTAGSGRFSRIISCLDSGTPVTAARTDVDYVVTEFGCARLSHGSLEERAERLIAVSHPDFRSGLEREAEELLSRLRGQ
jgi:4-hydroxybutyrate CoA-transferase